MRQGREVKPWCVREARAVAGVCLVLRYPSGFLSFSCSSHHPHGFHLLSLCEELPAPAALRVLPTLGRSHRLYLLPQRLQTQ